jgi:hypothetical protein
MTVEELIDHLKGFAFDTEVFISTVDDRVYPVKAVDVFPSGVIISERGFQ